MKDEISLPQHTIVICPVLTSFYKKKKMARYIYIYIYICGIWPFKSANLEEVTNHVAKSA